MKALFAAFLLSVGLSGFSQAADPVSATISAELQITLPTDQPLSGSYLLDISSLEFESEAAARQFFGMLTENVVRFEVNYPEQEVTILLQDIMTPSWDLAKWNNYFAGRAPKMVAVYNAL